MSTPITVIGNVTRNPQLSRTNSGTPVVNLSLAENHRRQLDGEWVDASTTYWEILTSDDVSGVQQLGPPGGAYPIRPLRYPIGKR